MARLRGFHPVGISNDREKPWRLIDNVCFSKPAKIAWRIFCAAMDLSRFYFINNSIGELLSGDDIDFLKQSIVQKHYSKGDNIYSEGVYPKGVFILDKGKIKIYQETFEGTQQIMNIHVQGEIIGYRPLLCGDRYPVTATAMEECRISFIPKKQFLLALDKSSRLSNMLLKFLSNEFTVWVNTISNLKHRTVKERLFLNLLILTEKYRAKKKWPVEITLSRADLAALIGTSNETLARLLKILRDEKYISVRGRTIIIQGPAQEERIQKSLNGLF
ncbi:Crp/Fnr family transcriptional regulator [Fulvivirgaceae bacterium PWU5]|uniref:Crp/Fnr family transcriptional regulator n=1 Tax=Dawidia cretensis TaxID=2782350 RepID=A0AAP2GWI4_9BACT|nr:Crp/Fnr family transcriptional regulator [Dawidia cretensis]MBT1710682.1 Crp/Fnr family transcriptional regulator [Dawidia cretensis]